MRNSFFSPFQGVMLFLLVLVFGCQYDMKEIDDIDFSSDLALPLINSKISVQEILDEAEDLSFLEVDGDGNIKFVYDDIALEKDLMDLIGDEISFPFAITNTSMSIPFDFYPNVQVNSMNLKGGNLSFELNTSYTENVVVVITIPSLRKNDQPFSTTAFLNYNGTTPTIRSTGPISVADYVLDMPNGNIDIEYVATLENGNQITLDALTGQADTWQIENLTGVWSQEVVEIDSSTLEIEIYDNWVDGDISFEDPKLSIIVDNSFGFPTRVLIKSLKVITLEDEAIDLISEVVGNSFDVAYPPLSEMGTVVQTVFTFDKSNSNIKELLNTKFKAIVYELEAMINPESSSMMGFLADNSQLKTSIRAELPIYGTAKGFRIESDSDVELDELENIREAEFKLICSNGLPVDVLIQFYFLNDQDMAIDSLFNNSVNVLTAAAVDGNGMVSENSNNTLLIPISDQHLDLLRNYGKIRMGATLSTTANGSVPVRLQSTQELEVKLGLKVGVQ